VVLAVTCRVVCPWSKQRCDRTLRVGGDSKKCSARERREFMKGVWRLPPNYISISIVVGTAPHRYRVSYEGQDPLVQVYWDEGSRGLLTGTTIDVTGVWLEIRPNGEPRTYPLEGGYKALD
jgi:hypothetical protein